MEGEELTVNTEVSLNKESKDMITEDGGQKESIGFKATSNLNGKGHRDCISTLNPIIYLLIYPLSSTVSGRFQRQHAYKTAAAKRDKIKREPKTKILPL
jgi:hypothetical protein